MCVSNLCLNAPQSISWGWSRLLRNRGVLSLVFSEHKVLVPCSLVIGVLRLGAAWVESSCSVCNVPSFKTARAAGSLLGPHHLASLPESWPAIQKQIQDHQGLFSHE